MADSNGVVAVSEFRDTVEILTERIAELELGLEDREWISLSDPLSTEFSRGGLERIINMSRLMYLKNPLINRAVAVQAFYVWGQGWSVQSRDPNVDAITRVFLDDPTNRDELTSHSSRMMKERELQITGNLFFIFFTSPNGDVRVRTINVSEIQEIICNPNDRRECWYYKRQWTQDVWNHQTGEHTPTQKTVYYPDWRYLPVAKSTTVGGQPVAWDSPVYHVRTGGLDGMQFGVPETYAALDWARAYKSFLEDWATIVKAYARFAWNIQTKGGRTGVAAAKARLGTMSGLNGGETNPPSVAGSTFIRTEGVDLQPIRTAGATTSAEDGRHLKLMVAAAMGIPEPFFGDPSTGNLATAKTLDRPTELKMRDRQTLWTDIFREILHYVVQQSAISAGGPLSAELTVDAFGMRVVDLGEIDHFVDISFPPLLERDIEASVRAIISVATLDGKQPIGTLDDRTLVRMLLVALGEDDIDELLDRLAPEGSDSLMAQRKEENEQKALEIAQQTAGSKDDEDEDEPDKEDVFTNAVRELRDAVRAGNVS